MAKLVFLSRESTTSQLNHILHRNPYSFISRIASPLLCRKDLKDNSSGANPCIGEEIIRLRKLGNFIGLRAFLSLNDFELYRIALLQ